MSDYENFNTIEILLLIIIPSIIAGVPSIISAIGAWKDKRKKLAESLNTEGSAAEKVSSAWEKLVEDLRKRAEDLQNQINKLEERLNKSDEEQKNLDIRLNRQRKRIHYLEDGVQILIRQLSILGVDPNFILKNGTEDGE